MCYLARIELPLSLRIRPVGIPEPGLSALIVKEQVEGETMHQPQYLENPGAIR